MDKRRLFAMALISIVTHLFLGSMIAMAAEDFDPKTDKPIIDMFRESPDAIPLEPRDPSKNLLNLYRDPNDNPKREPGPINIQKTIGGLSYQGIPTFFRAPDLPQ
jgi:hypothetical protein